MLLDGTHLHAGILRILLTAQFLRLGPLVSPRRVGFTKEMLSLTFQYLVLEVSILMFIHQFSHNIMS